MIKKYAYYIIGIATILFVVFDNIQNSYSAVLDQFRNNTNKNQSNLTNTFGNSTNIPQSSSNNNIAAPNSISSAPFS